MPTFHRTSRMISGLTPDGYNRRILDHYWNPHRSGFEYVAGVDPHDVPNPILMGCEIEWDLPSNGMHPSRPNEDVVADISRLTDMIYHKYDSTAAYGGELVSMPCSLRYHMNVMRWKQILKVVQKAGWRSQNAADCGYHIHVDREALGANPGRTIALVNVFVNRYWDEIKKFSRRRSGQWGWCKRPNISTSRRWTGSELQNYCENLLARDSTFGCYGDRYFAINATNNGTLEFRVFNGTLQRDTVIAAMQFTHNLVEWCRSHDYDDIQNATWSDVVQFRHFNELDKYLEKKGLPHVADPALAGRRDPDFSEGAA